jgi:hypothetical protein
VIKTNSNEIAHFGQDYNSSFGEGTFAKSYGETVVGLFNTDYTPADATGFDTTDRLFTIGNGTGIGSESDAFTILKNGNTAIGVDNFEADADAAIVKLKVGGALFVGDGTGTYGGSGEESKMFFAPAGSVFRAGSVAGTEWDFANLGSKSIGMGYAVAGLYTGPKASGTLSIALGTNTLASGANSFAMGFGAQATNTSAVAIGSSTASGSNSFAISNGIASGARAFAGASATSSATRSFAFGDSSNASAINAVAFSGGVASGQSSFAGASADATATGAFAFGGGNTIASAISATAFSDGLASGDSSFAAGGGQSSAFQTFAFGGGAIASNTQSFALGSAAIASGNNAFAIGQLTNATGFQSMSIGDNSTASGDNARTFGHQLIAPSHGETVVGFSNTSYTPVSATTWSDADRLFTVGGGSGSPLKADALTILKIGKVGINIDNFENISNQIAPTSAFLQVNGAIATNSDVYAQNVLLTSDSRLKKNIEDIPLGLAQINQLRPVAYDMRRDDSHQFGFIAQEVQSIFPDLVMDGAYLSLNYIGIIPVLTKAVQELDIKISDIDAQATAILANQGFLVGLSNWLADATNGIVKIFASEIETKSLCVADDNGEKTCITKSQLDQILSEQGSGGGGGSSSPAPAPAPEPTPEPDPVPDEEIVPPEPEPIPAPEPIPEPLV